MTGGIDILVVRRPGEVGLVRRADPAAGPGEILVRPDLIGICGTDLEIIDGQVDPAFVRYPLALGHEWTGTVTGDSALAGSRVVVEGIVPCGHCVRCAAGETNLCLTYDEIGFTRDGAAASLVAVPAAQVHPLDPAVSAEDAVFAEPASVVYQALTKAAGRPGVLAPGSRVLVIGDGTIGLLAVHLAGLWSPGEVVMAGRRATQAGLAEAAGATHFQLENDLSPAGFDLVIEAAGAVDAAAAAFAAARRGGTVVLLGLPPHGQAVPLAVDDVVNNDLAILGSFGYSAAAWRGVVRLLNTGRIRPAFAITHAYPLAEWERAIARLRGGGEGAGEDGPRGKVLLRIGDG